MHHAEFGGKSEETFGVADKEVAAGIQAMPELFDEALLFGFVEIDHDVAAEDDVVAARQEFGFQVVEVELNEFLELGLDGVLIVGLLEIAKPGGVIDGSIWISE